MAALAELDLGLQALAVGNALLEIGLGDGVLLLQARVPLLDAHGLFEQGLDPRQVGLGMGQAALLVGLGGHVGPRIDLGEDLVLLHLVVEIDAHLLDGTGNERPHLHAQHRLDRAGGIDHQRNVAAADRLRCGTRPPAVRAAL